MSEWRDDKGACQEPEHIFLTNTNSPRLSTASPGWSFPLCLTRGATGLSTSGNHSLFRLWFLAFTTVNLKTILGFNYFKKWKFPVKKLQCTNITLKYIATIGKSIYSYILTNTKKCLNEYHILKNHTLSTLPRRASLTLPPSYPSYRTSGSGRQQLHICP